VQITIILTIRAQFFKQAGKPMAVSLTAAKAAN
jgi:hypothetical protein